MLGRKIARHGIAILVTALLGPLLAVTMVRLAPGFDSDEAQLDSHLNSESIQALRQERLQQHNIFRFYFHSLQRAAQGDLGTSISLQQPVSKLLKDRAPLTLRIIGLGPASAGVQPASGGGTTTSSSGPQSGITSSLTVEITQCDAEFLTWFLGNTTVRYTLLSYKDYGTAPTEADPTCLTVTAAGGVSQKQVDAKYHFTAL